MDSQQLPTALSTSAGSASSSSAGDRAGLQPLQFYNLAGETPQIIRKFLAGSAHQSAGRRTSASQAAPPKKKTQ